MARQGLDDLDWGPTHGQRGNVGVTECVEVGEPIRGILVGHPSGFEVSLHHPGRVLAQLPEYGFSRGLRCQPGTKDVGEVSAYRLFIVATAFGVSGTNRHGRRVSVQVETLGGQATQLACAEPGPHREAVEHGAVGPVQTLDHRPVNGGLNQPRCFPRRHRPPLMAAVGVRVRAGKMREGVITSAAVPPQPPAERLGRAGVVVDRPEGYAGVTNRPQGGLYA